MVNIMNRVRMEDLRYLLKVLNNLTNEDEFPYVFYIAYGSYGLSKIVNNAGGQKTIIGLTTKRELYNQMEALIRGIEIGKLEEVE